MKTLDLIFELPVTYAFSGNDRDASASVAADTPVTPKVINTHQGGTELAVIPGGSPVRIKRARLLSPGYDKLQAPPGKTAGEVVLELTVSGLNPVPGSISVAMVQWNTWEEKDIAIDIGAAASFGLSIKSGSIIRMDDYNIQDAYASQVLTPLMELEIQVENKGVAVTH
jgi:hypothetical protein